MPRRLLPTSRPVRWALLIALVVTVLGAASGAVGRRPEHRHVRRTGAPASRGVPVIDGPARQEQTLFVSAGSWAHRPATYTYQWLDCNVGGRCNRITDAYSGATRRTTDGYTLRNTDVGARLRVTITAANAAGASTVRSSETPIVAASDANPYFVLNSTSPPFASIWGAVPSVLPSPFAVPRDVSPPGSEIAVEVTHSIRGPTSTSEMGAYYLLNPADAYAGLDMLGRSVQGQSTWYHALIYLPNPGGSRNKPFANCGTHTNDCYAPTTGHWNFLVAWHDDNTTALQGAHSIAMGVNTAYPLSPHVGAHPHFNLQIGGGHSQSPTYHEVQLPWLVKPDTWYSMLWHIGWSSCDGTARFPCSGQPPGLVQWWVNGVREANLVVPTLYTNPEPLQPSVSYNTFGIYNYRYDPCTGFARCTAWNSTADFAAVMDGPTRQSVGG